LFLNVLREASPLAAFLKKLHLWRLSEGRELVPSESFTAGGVAAFRRKRTCFEKSASFGKLHLWRVLWKASSLALPSESFTSGGFPKDV